MRSRLFTAVLAASAGLGMTALSACSLTPGLADPVYGTGSPGAGAIVAVGAESQYADVIGQVGGQYVRATAIMSNPNTDPHTFEASAKVAQQVGAAQLIVQNGLGYDSFMNTIESAAPSTSRKVVTVQRLLRLPDSTPNPHLWYKPGAMTAVADAIAGDLAAIQPAHAAYFKANAATFARSLDAWTAALSAFKAKYPATKVATTEPVADYMLAVAGVDNLTPWAFQADVMNGTDPSAQDVATLRTLLTGHKVGAFVYNTQVTDSLTQSFINLAQAAGVPVVGVYETMPAPGYDYQSWMLAEVRALTKAVASKTSTEQL
jgi:zinc/manganese transport system substrate-binding protein